jgi:signal transduction histidine kinase
VSSRHRRLLVDVLPSLVLTGVVRELSSTGAPIWQWIVALTLAWSLVARRYAPIAVFAVAGVLGTICILGDFGIVAAAGAFVALHAVAWRRPLRDTVVASAVLGFAAILAAFRIAPSDSLDDAFELICGIALLSILLGVTQQNQERALRELGTRTAELEAERERSARMAVNQERQRIAREIHDIVAHSVSVMIALSEGAARAPEEQARRTMREVAGTGRAALADLRRVLEVLRSADDDGPRRPQAPQPQVADLARLTADVERAGLQVGVEVVGDPEELPGGLQTTVYRIVQESLTNTLKHAVHASRAWVRLVVERDEVLVEVVDDGVATPGPPSAAGHGLRGMTERARAFGGTVVVGPAPGGGWRVSCVLPVRSRERAS